MKKSILLTLTLFCCSMWVFAQSSTTQKPGTSSGSEGSTASQTGSQTTSGHDMSSSSGMSGSETTISGCLSNSGGNYTLTDASGMTYQLQGDTSKLSSNVNKEVEVKGMSSASGSSSGSMGSTGSTGTQGTGTATTAGSMQMFTVSKVKKTADTCPSK